jgi:hypothetical protein
MNQSSGLKQKVEISRHVPFKLKSKKANSPPQRLRDYLVFITSGTISKDKFFHNDSTIRFLKSKIHVYFLSIIR